jgi:hypothetical protein
VCAFRADQPRRPRQFQPAVGVPQDGLDRRSFVRQRILRQSDQFHAALDRDAQRLDRLPRHLLGLGLRDQQNVVVAAVDAGEVDAEHAPASAVDAATPGEDTAADQPVGQAASRQQFQGARLHAEGAGCDRRPRLLVDDPHRDAEAGQFQRGGQSGGPGADDQDGTRHDGSPSEGPVWEDAVALLRFPQRTGSSLIRSSGFRSEAVLGSGRVTRL